MKNIDWKSSRFYLIPNPISETVITFKRKVDCLLDGFCGAISFLTFLHYLCLNIQVNYIGCTVCTAHLGHVGNKQVFIEYPLGTYHWHTYFQGTQKRQTQSLPSCTCTLMVYKCLHLKIKTTKGKMTAESEDLGPSVDFYCKQPCSIE